MNSNTEKYASPKEVKKTIHQFTKLLWVLPRDDRKNIISFIKEETKCCSWWPLPYVSQKLYDTLTGSLSSLNLKNKINQKETLHTPFTKILNNEKKSHQLMALIQKSMSFISICSPEKKEEIFNNILNEPFFYKAYNKFKYISKPKTISQKEFNLLFCPILQNQAKISPKILIISKKKSFYQITKDLRIYTHD